MLIAGAAITESEVAPRAPSWLGGLRHASEAPPARTTYWEYLDRRTASIAAGIAAGRPNPSLAVVLPESGVSSFLADVLSRPEASIGIWRIEIFPMITARFVRPLHKIPAGTMAFTVRLQRRASGENAPDHTAMLAANHALLPRVRAAGGKIYPPYAPIITAREWQEHYGPQTWQRFAAAKKRFDPANVLTPGAGIF